MGCMFFSYSMFPVDNLMGVATGIKRVANTKCSLEGQGDHMKS